MSDLPSQRQHMGVSRFASMAQGGSLRVEDVRGQDGRSAGIKVQSDGAGRPAWKSKALRWALGAAAAPTLLALAIGGGALAEVLMEGQPVSQTGSVAAQALNEAFAPVKVWIGQERASEMIAQAQADWDWADKAGYYRSPVKPAIGNFDAAAAFDAKAGPPETDKRTHFAANGTRLELSAPIQIARSIANPSEMLSSDDAAKEIKYTILHESYHSDTFMHPQTDVFGGSLAQGPAGDMWRAALWSNDISERAPRGILRGHEEERKEIVSRIGSLRNTYDESGADAFAMIALAHQLPRAEWNEQLIHLEGGRAETLLMSGRVGIDGHETQEGLQILAALGHDKLAALTPSQSMRLAEAVASDSVILAARKQGFEHDVYFAARNAGRVLNWGKNDGNSVYSRYFDMVKAKIMPAMMPGAIAWSQKGEQEQLDVNAQWLRESAQWNKGAHLDYGFIQPGLTATLAKHDPQSNYETRSGTGAWGALDNAQPANWKQNPDKSASLQGVRALQEWRDVAESLGEKDALEIEKTKQFASVVSLLDQPTKETLAKDAFWEPTLGSMAQRIAQRRAEDLAQKAAAQTASAQQQPSGLAAKL